MGLVVFGCKKSHQLLLTKIPSKYNVPGLYHVNQGYVEYPLVVNHLKLIVDIMWI